MTASNKGTVDNPGNDVKKQSRINRALLDASKSEWYGRTLLEVWLEYPSSQTCSLCGHIVVGLRLDKYR